MKISQHAQVLYALAGMSTADPLGTESLLIGVFDDNFVVVQSLTPKSSGVLLRYRGGWRCEVEMNLSAPQLQVTLSTALARWYCEFFWPEGRHLIETLANELMLPTQVVRYMTELLEWDVAMIASNFKVPMHVAEERVRVVRLADSSGAFRRISLESDAIEAS